MQLHKWSWMEYLQAEKSQTLKFDKMQCTIKASTDCYALAW